MSIFQPGLQPALDADGNTLSGAKWYFYQSGTTTPLSVYTDETLGTPLGTTVTADSEGRFTPAYMDDDSEYKAVLKTAAGVQVGDAIDPVNNEFYSPSFRTLEVHGNVFINDGGDLTISSVTGGAPMAIYNDDESVAFKVNGFERIYISKAGEVNIGGKADLANSVVIGGSGNLKVMATSSTGYGITTYATGNYTAVQFVRQVSGMDYEVGTITCTDVATAYNTSSDQRLKENIADAGDSGAIIDALQVRKFDWRANGSHQAFGFVAQELRTAFPDAVHVPDDPDKMQSIDLSKLVPLLVKEIQSLRTRVAVLEAR